MNRGPSSGLAGRSAQIRLVWALIVVFLVGASATALSVARSGGPRAARVQTTNGSFAARIPVPSAGEVSYGVAQVLLRAKDGAVPSAATAGTLAFSGGIGGLKIVARSPVWRSLAPTTKLYVIVSPVVGVAPGVRDVALFLVRRREARPGRPAHISGDVIVSIPNARAVTGSFWVRADRHGLADIFEVRDIVATALRNWSRYLRVLRAAGALQAAFRAGNSALGGVGAKARVARHAHDRIWTGGSRPGRRTRALFRLLIDGLGEPATFTAAKRNPLVADFIAHELGNPQLARRWRQIAAVLPPQVPDRYAAAAQEEARFSDVVSPRISRAHVTIADATNSSAVAGQALPSTSLSIEITNERGQVGFALGEVLGTNSGYGPNIDCNPADQSTKDICVVSFSTGESTEHLTAEPIVGQSTFAGWAGCDHASGVTCDLLVGRTARTVRALFNDTRTTLTTGSVEFGVCDCGTITSIPAGIQCPDICESGFAPGSTVELIATPSAIAAFTGWDGVCEGTEGPTWPVTMPPIGPAGVFAFAAFAQIAGQARATFVFDPESPQPPETLLTFNATRSLPPAHISDYVWNFGDGTPPLDTARNPITTHAYYCTGTVPITLTITADDGTMDTARDEAHILPESGFNPCPDALPSPPSAADLR